MIDFCPEGQHVGCGKAVSEPDIRAESRPESYRGSGDMSMI